MLSTCHASSVSFALRKLSCRSNVLPAVPPAAASVNISHVHGAQVTASFQFMPLPGAMFGEPADKAFRPAPRWASVTPEQVASSHKKGAFIV